MSKGEKINNYLIKVYCLDKLIHTKELNTFDDVCTYINYLKGMKQVFEKIEIYHKEILLTTWKFQKK
jgi:hypothetical protein